jgi:hypothetical protein
MTSSRLGDALRAGASGIHHLEAGTGLLIGCGSWLHREDFTSRFISAGTSISDGATLLAATDWEAAATALHAGDLPASGGERRMLLLAASIAGGVPVSLSDTLTGIDRRNASLVVRAIAHAAGQPRDHRTRRPASPEPVSHSPNTVAPMSFDMSVWQGERPADDAAARTTFRALYGTYIEREYPTPPTSKIAGFAAILAKRWPDDTDEAFDESPWAAAPLIREASGPFMYFAISHSRADEAAPFAAATAARLGLVCFNPQEGRLWR